MLWRMQYEHMWIAVMLFNLLGLVPATYGEFTNGVAHITTSTDRLVQDLTANHTIALPFFNKTPVTVDLSFSLFQILELNGQKQVLTVSGSLIMGWLDVHMRWNRSHYEGLTHTSLPAKTVWTPAIGLGNSVGDVWNADAEKFFPVTIQYDGRMTWVVTSKFASSCDLDMRNFPFDTQLCTIQFSSLVYYANVMDLASEHDKVITDAMLASKEYDLIETRAVRNETPVSDNPSLAYAHVVFSLTLKRKPVFYILTLLIPSLVLTLLTIVVFMVPTEAGEKISLSITVLLSFAVFLIILSDNIPRASVQVPILGVFLAMVIVITGLALFCTVHILNVYHVEPLRPMPAWFHRAVVIRLGTLLGMTEGKITASPTDHKSDFSTTSTIINIEDIHESDERVGGKAGDVEKIKDGCRRDAVSSIACDVHKILMSQNDAEKDEAIRKQWQLASRILDRFFLILYLVVILATALGMLVIYPLTISQ